MGDDLAGHQPVEEHADCGEVLLDARLGKISATALDVAGDDCWSDLFQRSDAARLTPTEEVRDGAGVGSARIRVSDVRREEFDKAPTSAITGASNERRHLVEARSGNLTTGWNQLHRREQSR